MNTGDRIKQRRIELGLTADDLAHLEQLFIDMKMAILKICQHLFWNL